MGLDIFVNVDNIEELHSEHSWQEEIDSAQQHSLSRTFCNFMCRRNVIGHEPELDQIGSLTGIDISPLYEMEDYPVEENLEYSLENAESEEEKQEVLRIAEEAKANSKGNIDKVLVTVTELINRLNLLDNLPSLLKPTDFDSLGNEEYFSAFMIDKGDGYIGNNFGQDLRNFKRFLEFAKGKGTTTVWFDYG